LIGRFLALDISPDGTKIFWAQETDPYSFIIDISTGKKKYNFSKKYFKMN
jgi:hypothetical protein